jgi:hypothetical protein
MLTVGATPERNVPNQLVHSARSDASQTRRAGEYPVPALPKFLWTRLGRSVIFGGKIPEWSYFRGEGTRNITEADRARRSHGEGRIICDVGDGMSGLKPSHPGGFHLLSLCLSPESCPAVDWLRKYGQRDGMDVGIRQIGRSFSRDCFILMRLGSLNSSPSLSPHRISGKEASAGGAALLPPRSSPRHVRRCTGCQHKWPAPEGKDGR